MQSPQGAIAPISEPIKIPDEGTSKKIIARYWGSSNETDEPRIGTTAAEPPYMKNSLHPPSKHTSQTMAAAPIPSKKPATIARERANLTLEQAAKKLRVQPRYLRDIERKGRAPYVFAERAALLYGCPVLTFLFAPATHEERVTGTLESHAEGRAKHPGQSAAATAGQSKHVRHRYPTLTLIKGG